MNTLLRSLRQCRRHAQRNHQPRHATGRRTAERRTGDAGGPLRRRVLKLRATVLEPRIIARLAAVFAFDGFFGKQLRGEWRRIGLLATAAQWFEYGIERAFDFRRIHNTRRNLLASEARTVMQ